MILILHINDSKPVFQRCQASALYSLDYVSGIYISSMVIIYLHHTGYIDPPANAKRLKVLKVLLLLILNLSL